MDAEGQNSTLFHTPVAFWITRETCTKIWWSLAVWFLRYASRQTDRHHNTSHPSLGAK